MHKFVRVLDKYAPLSTIRIINPILSSLSAIREGIRGKFESIIQVLCGNILPFFLSETIIIKIGMKLQGNASLKL